MIGGLVATYAGRESLQLCMSSPAISPINKAAPATMGSHIRSTSFLSSRNNASTVFPRLSREYVRRLLADSIWATTPPCESDKSWSAVVRSLCASVMDAVAVCNPRTVSGIPDLTKCWRRLSPNSLAICCGSRPASISLGSSASRDSS